MKKNIHIVIIAFIFSVILWGSISLSNEYYSTVLVPLRLINLPAGYTTGSHVPENISLKLRGRGWKLVSMNLGAESNFVISADNDSGSRYINLFNYLSDNSWLSSDIEVMDIAPDTFSVSIEKITTKKLPVIPALEITYKPGFGLASPILIRPDSVVVYGAYSSLRRMTAVLTKPLKLDEMDNKVNQQLEFEEISGLSYSREGTVISLDVQKIVDKSFENIPIEILDIPPDREVVLLPNRIDINLKGGINILGKLRSDSIRAFIYYGDVVLDTVGSIAPEFKLPQNTSLIYSKPERLRYVITRFN